MIRVLEQIERNRFIVRHNTSKQIRGYKLFRENFLNRKFCIFLISLFGMSKWTIIAIHFLFSPHQWNNLVAMKNVLKFCIVLLNHYQPKMTFTRFLSPDCDGVFLIEILIKSEYCNLIIYLFIIDYFYKPLEMIFETSYKK